MMTSEDRPLQEDAHSLFEVERGQHPAAPSAGEDCTSSDALRALIETMPVGVMVCNERGNITLANRAANIILNAPPAGAVFALPAGYTLYHADGSPFLAEELPLVRAIQHAEASRDMEILLRREDGKEFILLVAVSPLCGATGNVIGAVLSFQDITEAKRVELALRTLHAITTDRVLSFEEKLHRLLAMGCRQYGLPIGILAQIEDETYTVREIVAPDDRIPKGSVFPLGCTYCRDIIHGTEPVCVEHVGASDWRTHPCYTQFKLEAYIAMPVVAAGKVYGTINFSSLEPRPVRFTATDREILKLMAQWAGSEIERRQVDEALQVHARQQAAASELGLLALAGLDLYALMDRAVAVTAQALAVEYVDVMEFLPEQDALLLRAGVGWRSSLIGRATVSAQLGSQVGYALRCGEPVVVEDTQKETRFSTTSEGIVPELNNPALNNQGVVSSISVPIPGEQHPYGVLSAHTAKRRVFSRDDIHFLQMVAHVLATAHQRSRAEEALRLRDRAIAAAPEGIVITDPRQPDNPIIYVNAGFERLTGYSAAEVRGRNCRFLRGPDTDLAALAQIRQAIREERECTVQILNYRKDGTPFWNLMSISPVRDTYGRPIYFVGVQTDITERQRTEFERQKFVSLVENSSDFIGMADLEGKPFFINPAGCRLVGLDGLEAVAATEIRDYCTGATWALLRDIALPIARAQGAWQGEGQLRHFKTGRPIDVEMNIFWIRHPQTDQPLCLAGVMHDITERKKVERMKREFISTVSHELRTPLTSICGSLGLVKGGVTGELPMQAKGLIEIAYRNSERLVRLVNDILDMDRMESGRLAFAPRPMELLPLVQAAMDLNRAYAESLGVQLVLNQALPGARAYIDPDRIIQVLTNLLSNAAKFSPRQGIVSVSMARCGNCIHLAVTDRGPGIPEEFKIRIFDKFAQADASDSRRRGGTGLGLHIAKAIVEQSGGTIGFETTPEGGTTFYCDLPEWQEAGALVSDAHSESSPSPAPPKRLAQS